MKLARVKVKSDSPYSQSRQYSQEVPKKPKEGADDYEGRTWINRLHVLPDGHIYIPGTAFANCLKEAAKRMKLQVPNKGRLEYTKYFEAGVMVIKDLVLDVKASDVACDKLFVPSDGKRGGGKRVWRHFPRIDSWSGTVEFWISDDIITEDVFRQVIKTASQLVGIGRFRPEKCGFYGRFMVESIQWIENAEELVYGAAAE